MADVGQDGLLNTCPDCAEVVDVSNYGPYEKIACPACGGAMRVRTHFNHFAIEGKLGEGGMSQVFRAKDLTLNRSVALKILHRVFTADPELTKQFETEARLTASISHPNVVKVYSVGEDQGYFYIAMEVVEGVNLEELIGEEGKLPESRVWDIGIQVAQGLRAAQKTGLIHRDIKPGNILLAHREVAKIVDFGLALVAGRDVDESKTIWATPFYVPPEKLHDEPEDLRSDIYSLGATLFHALAGRPPFDANTQSLEELRKIKDRPVRLEDAAPEVSGETCRVIDRMLARNPADRFENYDELLREMNAARALGGDGRRPEPYSQRTLAIAAGVFLVAAAVILIRGRGGRESGPEIPDVAAVEALPAAGLETEPGEGASEDIARFVAAREMLIAGKFEQARAEFRRIVEGNRLAWPTADWAVFNAGLGALLDGEVEEAREHFRMLGHEGIEGKGAEDAELATFFSEAGRHLSRDLPVMTDEIDAGAAGTVFAMGWLAYGVKNWQDGRFEEAMDFFEAFERASPPQRLEWINAYKALLEPFEKDMPLISLIPAPKSSMNLAEIEDVLRTFEEMNGRLRTKGSGVRLLEERWARAKTLQEREVEELKRNERERIAAAKMEEDLRRAAENSKLADLLAEAARLEAQGAFREAADMIEGSEFQSAEVREAAADALRMYTGADRFVPTLLEDLNQYGYSGEIGRSGAPALEGSIEKANLSEVRVRLQLGGAVGETTIPFSSLSREGLLRMAAKIASGTMTESERLKRREMAILYARLTGMNDYASAAGAALALENEDFAEFWKRLPVIEAHDEGTENPS